MQQLEQSKNIVEIDFSNSMFYYIFTTIKMLYKKKRRKKREGGEGEKVLIINETVFVKKGKFANGTLVKKNSLTTNLHMMKSVKKIDLHNFSVMTETSKI